MGSEEVKVYLMGLQHPLGLTYGYFFPRPRLPMAKRAVRVCQRDDCPLGPYVDKPTRLAELSWSGGDLGDFSSGIGRLIAKRSVAEHLRDRFPCIDLHAIDVVAPRGSKGSRLEESVRHIVPRQTLAYDPLLSSLEVEQRCDACCRMTYRIAGVETRPEFASWKESQPSIPGRRRVKGMGIMVYRAQLQDAPIFCYGRIYPVFVTSEVKEFVEALGWTNVVFLEYGDVL